MEGSEWARRAAEDFERGSLARPVKAMPRYQIGFRSKVCEQKFSNQKGLSILKMTIGNAFTLFQPPKHPQRD